MMSFARFMASAGGRAIRTTAGIALIAIGLVLGGGWLALAAFGLLPLATGVLDLCPVAVLAKLPVTGDAFRDATCKRCPARIPWAVSPCRQRKRGRDAAAR